MLEEEGLLKDNIKLLFDPSRLRCLDSACLENDELYEILLCSSTFSRPRMITNVFQMFLYIHFS